MGLLQKLQEYENFTDSESKLADYILQHAEEISAENIAQLAQKAYTSNPTIIRLCRKVGMDGYREFRITLAAELEKQRYERSGVDINYPFVPKDSVASVMKNIASISKEALDTCYASISPSAIEAVANELMQAEMIYIYAAGDTAITATGFANMLMKLGIHTVMANQYQESMAISHNATDRDFALLISYSGNHTHTLKNELKILKQHGCRIAAISSLEKIGGTDYLINFPPRERVYGKTAGYYSQTSIRYILNCLYGVIYTKDLQQNMRRKDRVERMHMAEG